MMLAAQLLLSLSILIVLHELGHFLPAKFFKIRVEKFYLFFDPWFSLIKKKVGDTVYGIGWLPLGGYVKISGMVDESMDKEQMAKPPEPWEFRSKPAWQRLIVMIGGVVVNVIVGIVLYSMVFWVWGKEVLPIDKARFGFSCSEMMLQYGFKSGDQIVALDGANMVDVGRINKTILLDDVKIVTINRDGQRLDLTLPDNFGQVLVDSAVHQPFSLRFPTYVDSVVANKPAALAGLIKGDSIVGINDLRTPYFNELAKVIKSSKGQTLNFHLIRKGEQMSIPIQVDGDGAVGFMPASPMNYFEMDTIRYSLAASIPAGASEAWETITDYSSQLRFLFSKSGAKQLGGFATFAKLFPDEWDWWKFWTRTAFISLILAFMNILPIPALDGGHVIFLIWEMVTGKAVSQKVLETSQVIGMVILLGLMLFGNGMDVFRAIKGG
jgi:regulator of sigma E protease